MITVITNADSDQLDWNKGKAFRKRQVQLPQPLSNTPVNQSFFVIDLSLVAYWLIESSSIIM